jgi:hypothetical protein
MHPESLCCDTTFGTENKKKELFDVAGLDSKNKGINAGRAYIPNAQQWGFFVHVQALSAFPFWGAVVASHVRLMVLKMGVHRRSTAW